MGVLPFQKFILQTYEGLIERSKIGWRRLQEIALLQEWMVRDWIKSVAGGRRGNERFEMIRKQNLYHVFMDWGLQGKLKLTFRLLRQVDRKVLVAFTEKKHGHG